MSSNYQRARDVFADRIDPTEFVHIESNIPCLEKLHQIKDQKFKIALLQGESGVGKSMLLRRFIQEAQSDSILYYPAPFFDLRDFEKKLKRDLGIESDEPFLGLVERLDPAEPYLLILDEAQIYDEEFLEFFRLLSDTSKFKVLFALHDVKNKESLIKEHFQNRIFAQLSLRAPSKKELQIYIQKRLVNKGLNDIAQLVGTEDVKRIYRFTKGNLRRTNAFLYLLFDILDYFERSSPSQTDFRKIPKKFIEMSAIHLGYIHA